MAPRNQRLPSEDEDAPPDSVSTTVDPMVDMENKEWERIAGILESYGDGAQVMLKCKKRGEKDYVHMGFMPVDGFSVDAVADEYGGGEYKCTVKRTDGKLGQGFTLRIDHRKKGRLDNSQSSSGSTTPADVLLLAKQLTPDNSALIAMLKDQADKGDKTLPLIIQMMQQSQAQQMQMMTGMMAAMAQMGQGRSSQGDMMPLLQLLLPILLTKDKPLRLKDMIEDVHAVQEMLPGGAPKEEEGVFASLLKTVGPKLLEVLAPVLLGGGAPPEGMMPQPGTVQQQLPPAQPQPINQEQEEMKLMMALAIKQLIAAARRNEDPAKFYEKVENIIPEDVRSSIVVMLQKENWFEELTKQIPDLTSFYAWCEGFRNRILQDYQPEPIIPTPTAPTEEFKVGCINHEGHRSTLTVKAENALTALGKAAKMVTPGLQVVMVLNTPELVQEYAG